MRLARLPRGLGTGCRGRLLELLASSPPLSVSELSKALRVSYMGVKAQCVKLEKLGYLATQVRRRERGRPETLYRLTPKGRELFPQGGVELALSLLAQAAKLSGPPMPGKMLFAHFQERGEFYRQALKSASLAERARELAALRAAEGCFLRVEDREALRLIEAHNPLTRLFREYPEAVRFETAAISHALGVPVFREEGANGEVIFFVGTHVAMQPQKAETPPVPDSMPPQAPNPPQDPSVTKPAGEPASADVPPTSPQRPVQTELFELTAG